MNVALYADYIADLRTLFAELDRHLNDFRLLTFVWSWWRRAA
ncbi:hypothetical protein FHX14_005185 [Rhizobium sp. BK619]|nr:hypothetical protein [Rhizobium sp. BK619]